MMTFRIPASMRSAASGSFIPLTLGAALMIAAPLAASAPAAAQGGFFGSSYNREDGQIAVRLGQLEEQVRSLTGQVEELTHHLRQTQDQLRRVQEDAEFRFQELEGGKPGKRSQAPAAAPAQNSASAANTGGHYGRAEAPSDNEPYAAERDATVQNLGSYSTSGQGADDTGGGYTPSGQPLDLSALARGNSGGNSYEEPDNPTVGGSGVPGVNTHDDAIGRLASASSSDGSARAQYDQAYSMVLNGQYNQAAQGFKQFLASHPDDPLAANAQYWLGESYFGRGKYRDAADAFLKTYTGYPANDKTSDSLLKLGLSLDGLGQKDAACATYSELLTKYPGASGAVLDQARKERESAGCRG
ncbi:tol-pal system protein YbgF [Breoghania sp.]|uniref:tol-pal system protein YbgF n=1 Tax=Breoghania sp. TaxID=2065378 RepID=UPI0026254D18|nr:tol-pal system protein YbgF [Breoghania sp.]MDJ0931954.1 tol-pal system protein YbgF [Breoghania sp.]